MNGELAQLISLAAHGTKWLRDPAGPPPPLDQTNSTFKFVAAVHFHSDDEPGSGGRGSVENWLETFHRSGVDRLWLTIPESRAVSTGGRPVNDHSLVGFANAGRWSILASRTTKRRLLRSPRTTSELWHATWKMGDRTAPDSRIWLVNYVALPVAGAVAVVPELGRAEDELTEALTEAHDLAVEQKLDSWAEWFSKALASDPEMPYHSDMLPRDWPGQAQRCGARAAQAWVLEEWGRGTTSTCQIRRYKIAMRRCRGGSTAQSSAPWLLQLTAISEAVGTAVPTAPGRWST